MSLLLSRCAYSGIHCEATLNCFFIPVALPQRKGLSKQLSSDFLASRGWAVCSAPRSCPLSLPASTFPLPFSMPASSSSHRVPRRPHGEVLLVAPHWTCDVPCWGAMPYRRARGMAVTAQRSLLWQCGSLRETCPRPCGLGEALGDCAGPGGAQHEEDPAGAWFSPLLEQQQGRSM